MGGFFATLLMLLAIVLILLVLVQRGRGGGLAGALGGMGGSSAFGAKAGDVFTRITIYVAVIWISVCIAAEFWGSHRGDVFGAGDTGSSSETDVFNALPGTGTTDTGVGDGAATRPIDQGGPVDGAGPTGGAGAADAAGSTSTTTGGTNSGTPPADDQ